MMQVFVEPQICCINQGGVGIVREHGETGWLLALRKFRRCFLHPWDARSDGSTWLLPGLFALILSPRPDPMWIIESTNIDNLFKGLSLESGVS